MRIRYNHKVLQILFFVGVVLSSCEMENHIETCEDDVAMTKHRQVASFGISESEFYPLSQEQYDKASKILKNYFQDSIPSNENGVYLIERPEGYFEYLPYPYEDYVRQFWGYQYNIEEQEVVVFLISKELFYKYAKDGQRNDEMIWIEDGGSDAVDVIINLEAGVVESFGVHQES